MSCLSVEAVELLIGWHWPGNVRELRNTILTAAARAAMDKALAVLPKDRVQSAQEWLNMMEGIGGNVTAGSSCTFSVLVTVPPATPDDTYLNVTSPLSATIGGPVSLPAATDGLEVNSNLLQMTKEFTDDPVAPGGVVNLHFTLANLSSSLAISDIAFSDDLDAALSGLVSTSGTLADVCGKGHNLAAVGIFQPFQYHRGIKTSGIGKYGFFNICFRRHSRFPVVYS